MNYGFIGCGNMGGAVMEGILRSGKAKGIRFGTVNRICYFLHCDVGDILKFDGNLEENEYET